MSMSDIASKATAEMTPIEYALWRLYVGGNTTEAETGSKELARLQAIEEAAKKAQSALQRVKPQTTGILVVQDIDNALIQLAIALMDNK